MVVPAIIAGLMVGSAIVSAVSQIYRNYQENETQKYNVDFNTRAIYENERYWSDYKKNTGYSPRYPQRVGAEYNQLGLLYGQNYLNSYYLNQSGAIAHGATGIGMGLYAGRSNAYRSDRVPSRNYNPPPGYY